MPLPSTIHVHPTAAALADDLGRYVVAAIVAAIARHGKFVVALSGGSLPKVLSQALESAVASGASLQTEAWHVFYADERIVPLSDADSNHLACKSSIFDKPWFKAPAEQLHPINPSLQPADCAADYATHIVSVLGGSAAAVAPDGSVSGASVLPQFDLILLGMGPDGHTASLFPDHPLLAEHSRLVAEITDSPKPPLQRVTLTYPLINHAVQVAFVATGESKAPVLRQIFDPSIPLEKSLPSARIRQADTALPTWFVDTPAAAGLK